MWKDRPRAWRPNRKMYPRCLIQETHVATSARNTVLRKSRAATQQWSKLTVSNADLMCPHPHPQPSVWPVGSA